MKTTLALILGLSLLSGCGGSADPGTADDAFEDAGHGHEHAEESLGAISIDGIGVILKQGHGKVEAGKEGHLVVKLTRPDDGATTVRAWLGTEDRASFRVEKGTYVPEHGDYDVHATAPDPLPADVHWWIELETPDGERHVASVPPLL